MVAFPSFTPTSIIAGQFPLVHRTVTVLSGSNTSGTVLPRGTVLGIITASGKATTSVETVTDGSQTPKCILAVDVDSSAGDVAAPAYYTGEFAGEYLTYGAGHTFTTVDAAFALTGQPIFVKSIGTAA